MAPVNSAQQPDSAQQCGCACACGKKAATLDLFVDEEFPARWNVLGRSTVATSWLRPHEIRAEPRLFVNGCSRFAVQQGSIGDCWFLAACAAVVEREDLIKQVIPEGQVLYGPGYDGSVTFRLWHQGEWREVRIDDRIPVDGKGVPVYAHCRSRDEFWLPLLEKAFAKFHKHFAIIGEGGWLSEGLVNLTGYSMQSMDMETWNVWNIDVNFEKIKYASDIGALIVCRTTKSGPGLPGYHAYTVTKVYQRDPQTEGDEKLQLLRVRNPWGGGTEIRGGVWKYWDGQYNELCRDVRDALEYTQEANGEFWIPMKDFTENFYDVVIATPRPIGAEDMEIVGQITGSWSNDNDTGGDHTDIEKFSKNPQFLLVTLGNEEKANGKEENPINTAEGIEAIVELHRAHCRRMVHHLTHMIAFYIFETCTERRLSAEQLLQVTYVTGATEPQREVCVSSRVRLLPGRRYVVVPATLLPGQEGEFLLRVFSKHARVRLTELPP